MIDIIDAWLRLAAARLHEQTTALTALDQAIGDGDHGTNMDRGFTAIAALLDAGPPDGQDGRELAAARLRTAGRTLISTVGGAAGPLYGTALLRAGGAVAAGEASATAGRLVVDALDAAVTGIQGLGKATAGEKTMLDCLMPAADAGRAALDRAATDAAPSAGRWPMRPKPGRSPRSRCSPPRVARPIWVSGPSATRTPVPRPPRCCCGPSRMHSARPPR